MSVSPRDVLNLALTLQGAAENEATSRCVVSRAYYAALHCVEQTFEKRDGQFKVDGESSHQEIITRALVYGRTLSPGRTSASEIAKMMPRLRRTRNQADYDIAGPHDSGVGQDTVIRAARIFELCEDVKLKNETPKTI